MTLDQFIDKVASATTDDAIVEICRRSLLHGTPHVFHQNEDGYYTFRKRISDQYRTNFFEIHIVGSAKLGFSPLKMKQFDLDSDIDVAISSTFLFDNLMEKIRIYQMSLRENRLAINERELREYHRFLEYVAIGWIRPDLLPISFQMKELKDDWFDYFNSISNGKSEVGNYKVSGAIYKNYEHLEKYTISSIKTLRDKVLTERASG